MRLHGERYLWIDRFCIVQDSETKLAQINTTAGVYSGAYLYCRWWGCVPRSSRDRARDISKILKCHHEHTSRTRKIGIKKNNLQQRRPVQTAQRHRFDQVWAHIPISDAFSNSLEQTSVDSSGANLPPASYLLVRCVRCLRVSLQYLA